MTHDSKMAQRAALGVLIFGACSIAFAGIFMRLSVLEPTATAFWRTMLAVPLLGVILMRPGSGPHCVTRGRWTWLWLLLPGVTFTGDLAFWHWAMDMTTVANATLLANFAPIFVSLTAVFLFSERLTPLFLVGLCLGICGMVFLSWGNLYLSRETLIGDALGLVTAVFYGAYQLSVRYVRRHYSAMAVMAGTSVTCSVLLFLIAWINGESFFDSSVPWWQMWLPLIGLAALVHVMGQGSIAHALAHLPSAFSSVTLMFQPVVTAALAWIILKEAIGPWQGLGGVIILVGILFARLGTARTTLPQPEPPKELV